VCEDIFTLILLLTFFDLIVMSNGYQAIAYSNYICDDCIDASIDCVKYADETFMEKIILDGLTKQ